MSIQLSPSSGNLPISSSAYLPPLPSPVLETIETHSPSKHPPESKMASDGKIIDWPVLRKKVFRKGPWLPSNNYITLIACDLVDQAVKKLPLEKLYRMVLAEWSDVKANRRPVLDDRKVFFYEMVLEYVEELLAAEEKKEAMDVDREAYVKQSSTEESRSTYYSDSDSDDSPVSEIDWEMIAAAAAADEDKTEEAVKTEEGEKAEGSE
ncbi:hypothetical protein B0T14DRAFT_558671 [Immersiella caudata]|uniref:Uncharacterized protein n=1 Tax=Immersiella caudata TaxID=314043 RepID=A0AA39WB98_9PEZI|nr:hypothetical protein B0T14DRAFT_558671 [Immersiella caudata]